MLNFLKNQKKIKRFRKILAFFSLTTPMINEVHASSTITGAITGPGDVTFTTSGTITVTGAIQITNSSGVSAPDSGAGNIFVSAGTTILHNLALTTTTPTDSNSNTYTGATIINGGELQLYIGQIPEASQIYMGGTSTTSSTGTLTFAEDFTLSNAMHLNSTSTNGNIFGALSNITGSLGGISTSNSVLITGSGTISLASTCTLSGTVTVTNSSTLQTAYGNALGSTPLVLDGGTLDLKGHTTGILTSVVLDADSYMESSSGTNSTCIATSFTGSFTLDLADHTNISSSQSIGVGTITTHGTCSITFGSGYTLSSNIIIGNNLTISAQ